MSTLAHGDHELKSYLQLHTLQMGEMVPHHKCAINICLLELLVRSSFH